MTPSFGRESPSEPNTTNETNFLFGSAVSQRGFRFCEPKTQREIADFLCTTEVLIRKSYNSWLNEFPQFFTDLTIKM